MLSSFISSVFPRFSSSLLIASLCWSVAGDLQAAERREMYRYTNKDGVKVLNSTIPPEYVQGGYEVVNMHGDVIRVVDPGLDAAGVEELKRLTEEKEAEIKWDRELLKRYSTVADVESAKSRRLAEINTSLAILRGNIVSLDSQIAREQAKAADRERRGQEVPEAILTNIKNFKLERAAAERMIENRLADYDEVASRFDRDIDRFVKIQQRLDERR